MNPHGLVDELEAVWPDMARLLRNVYVAKVEGPARHVIDRRGAWDDELFPEVDRALRLIDEKFHTFDRSYVAGRRAVWAPYQPAAIKAGV